MPKTTEEKMSQEGKIVKEISAWKNKHSADGVDTRVLDTALKTLVENDQQIANLHDVLKSATKRQKELLKALEAAFATTKVSRKEQLKTKEKTEATATAPAKAKTVANPTKTAGAAKVAGSTTKPSGTVKEKAKKV